MSLRGAHGGLGWQEGILLGRAETQAPPEFCRPLASCVLEKLPPGQNA